MRATAWHLDSTRKTPQEPAWARLSGACPDCGRLLAHLEATRTCLACGWEAITIGGPDLFDDSDARRRQEGK